MLGLQMNRPGNRVIPFDSALLPPPPRLAWGLLPLLATASTGAGQGDQEPPEERAAAAFRRSALHTLEAATEILGASDIRISETTLRYQQTTASWEWSLSGFLNTFDEEYRPVGLFDPIGRAAALEERTWGNQLTLRKQVVDTFALTAAGGYYDGFDGYRSLWLDEYYRQQFSFVPGYKDADPWGANVSGGLAWDYIPANATLEARIRYNRDVVAPGYEIETDPVTGAFAGLRRGRESLDTISLHVATENVLGRRVRGKLEGILTDTTDREVRLGVQGSLNVAMGDRWVARGQAGFTTEEPTFDAWFVGGALEYEPRPGLYLFLAGHYYQDTGEILNALQLSSAAPGLDAWNAGGGLRYVWPQASIKVFAGPYFTDYEPVEMGTAPFGHLYQDRSWWLARLAFNVQF